MQFSTIIVALFAGIAVAGPAAPAAALEARQNTMCDLCRKDCFFSRGSNDNFKKCLNTCNKDLGCKLTP
ncbi:hypothetical protein Cob_v001246 [Colletotrichum orbiculare MAFF 240422]|uniref:Uncharacterized protein n=1 Tax=Colletotrichum orbiculare (strain 104-T / ATCC 96160 / CBS 514.97 / LARS 414 / MAFF 240422) TaxID=1213857 RepID=N4VKU0_COLOR|nr:hypothetical protein Cob_v001246 [Colletotrichum orbiculare MAFF 240422]